MYRLLIIFMIGMVSIGAMEEKQMGGEVRFGKNSVCFWNVQGPEEFCKRMEKQLGPEPPHPENFTMSSPDGKTMLQISPEGQFIIGDDGRQECIVMRDAHAE